MTSSGRLAIVCLLAVGVVTASSLAGSQAVPPRVPPQRTALPETRFATSSDETRIAYDVTGGGPAVLLLHGGGQTRRMWHSLGYVARLQERFTVIAVDMRGNGESDKPTNVEAYHIDRLTADLLAVADAAGAKRFAVWGFSYGANIGRYLAVRSDRVSALAIVGIPFGPAASGVFRETILGMRLKWLPVLQAQSAGRFDPDTLSDADRAIWNRGTVALNLAWLGAMLDYPAIVPADLRPPTLWLVGSANAGAMESAREYEGKLAATRVTLHVLDGFTHPQEIERIDRALPLLEKFAGPR
jgi:pimeloyl-ACP methyl ester carboxylesterase